MQYTDVIERIPPAIIGSAQICHDEPSKIERMRAAMHGMPLDRQKYARLLINGSVMMTDAEFERRTNAEFMREAHGDVLIAGLGLGLILDPVVKRCDSVTVVEINPDVIALVAPQFQNVSVIHGDILKWSPAKEAKYDTIYFDIWPYFNEDTNRQAGSLHRRFRKYLNDGGWMKSWCTIATRCSPRR